jgi:hypothetical protein
VLPSVCSPLLTQSVRRNDDEVVRAVFCRCSEDAWGLLRDFHSAADDVGPESHVVSFVGVVGKEQWMLFWEKWDTATGRQQVPEIEERFSVVAT